ncbi:MAG: trigger factor [Lachnospiraceae bacterium]|nr:trigger factor [Lachnospiraceae bacterium]
MRKRIVAAAMLLCLLTGCGKSNVTIADLRDMEVEKYVTLPDYKNMEIQRQAKIEITDADVKSYINSKVNAVSELHEPTGTVENGDVVNIDYAGTIDGTAFEGGTAQSQLLEIGSGSFIEGFEEGLVGANVGETKELSLQFPENYRSADVAGKDCVFAVKINYILSELTDENVGLVDPGYQSADAYREDAGIMLRNYAQYQYERTLKSYIATSLIAGCTYEEVPESLVEDYRNSLQTDFENEAAAAGVSLEQYMANTYYISADSIEDGLDAAALRCAKEGLALQAIANAEGISVSDEELDETIAGYTSSDDAEEELDKESVRVSLLYDKVYSFLVEIYGE